MLSLGRSLLGVFECRVFFVFWCLCFVVQRLNRRKGLTEESGESLEDKTAEDDEAEDA
jgi:hypothetical protein